MTPEPYAALPGDGVYAGRVVLDEGSAWPAAISVGTPPTFPEARDYVEAHLIGFDGDLYDTSLTLEFVTRLRPQEHFSSLTMLTDAIRADVARTLELVPGPEGGLAGELVDADDGHASWDRSALFADALAGIFTSADTLEDGTPVVDDPMALEAAEREAAHAAPPAACGSCAKDWVCVFGPARLSSLFSDGGSAGAIFSRTAERRRHRVRVGSVPARERPGRPT